MSTANAGMTSESQALEALNQTRAVIGRHDAERGITVPSLPVTNVADAGQAIGLSCASCFREK